MTATSPRCGLPSSCGASRRPRPVRCCAAPSGSARLVTRSRLSLGSSRSVAVAHCGPTLKGEFTRTVNMTDVLTGWTFTRSIRNNAERHIISALDAAVGCVPFPVLGVDFVGGSEFINHSVVRWAGDLDIYSRPLTPLQEERPGHHRVEEQPPGAPLRLLLPLRHQRGVRGPGAAPLLRRRCYLTWLGSSSPCTLSGPMSPPRSRPWCRPTLFTRS